MEVNYADRMIGRIHHHENGYLELLAFGENLIENRIRQDSAWIFHHHVGDRPEGSAPVPERGSPRQLAGLRALAASADRAGRSGAPVLLRVPAAPHRDEAPAKAALGPQEGAVHRRRRGERDAVAAAAGAVRARLSAGSGDLKNRPSWGRAARHAAARRHERCPGLLFRSGPRRPSGVRAGCGAASGGPRRARASVRRCSPRPSAT